MPSSTSWSEWPVLCRRLALVLSAPPLTSALRSRSSPGWSPPLALGLRPEQPDLPGGVGPVGERRSADEDMPPDAVAAERAAHTRGAHDTVLRGRDDRVPCLLFRDHDPCEARRPSSRRKNDCNCSDSCGGEQKSSLHGWLPPLEPASRRRDALGRLDGSVSCVRRRSGGNRTPAREVASAGTRRILRKLPRWGDRERGRAGVNSPLAG